MLAPANHTGSHVKVMVIVQFRALKRETPTKMT